MKRREFTRIAGLGAMAMHAVPAAKAADFLNLNAGSNLKIPLGVVNHSLRAWRPNALELIEFAGKYKLDSVSFNTLKPFQDLDDTHLKKVKELADERDLSIFIGVGGICEQARAFSDDFGDADNLIKEGIRVATALESPVLGVRIGNLEDRYTDGGIAPKMEEVINRMKSFREPILDAGIKFAFENHAGDMRIEELKVLMDETGKDICGAYFDPGNAIYAMEDPIKAMEALGDQIICCSARDVMIWPTDDGAIFQWTAVGEGLTDFNKYTQLLGKNSPGVPVHLEIISNSPRSIPFLRDEYWKGWPDLKAEGIVDFLKLIRQGHPIDTAQVPSGMDKKEFEKKNQEEELLKSIQYLRKEYGVGLKS